MLCKNRRRGERPSPCGVSYRPTGEVLTVQRRRVFWPAALALVAALALLASACGGSNNESSGSTTTQSTTGSSGKTFSNFRIVYDTGIDYLDPGLSYTVEGWEIMWNVYIPLLTYKHVNGPDGATIIPGLAESLPTVSKDGTVYELTLKKGLTYSDGTPVKASDFKKTIERLFLIDSPGVGFFGGIVGADDFAKTKKGGISGISTDDATGKITIKLVAPQGDFDNILATTFAAPVPPSTPAKDQSTTPAPATG